MFCVVMIGTMETHGDEQNSKTFLHLQHVQQLQRVQEPCLQTEKMLAAGQAFRMSRGVVLLEPERI